MANVIAYLTRLRRENYEFIKKLQEDTAASSMNEALNNLLTKIRRNYRESDIDWLIKRD